MISVISVITNKVVLKWAFGYSCAAQFASLVTQSGTEAGTFVENILSSVPSQVAGYLGVIYGVAIVVKKVSEVWKEHHLDRYEIKTAKENFYMKEMETRHRRNEEKK
tara:strand:- start:1267 stop:1587 length:321 start_codon:yes stop_codon:yes gene_type:complete